ncbi:hypothetical protein [Actinomycetospora chibensis]|uniref:VOC domain-containing protein n=1 Tax=Actinomycetospora chibensis TaxID=663606 RepID=A0ABV9RIT1_9PSEU|nr:hypothetical protein [Actinomycetospora chibensis]MDD7922447.1 hypothetical protein [Actinomycetospora chibensis]
MGRPSVWNDVTASDAGRSRQFYGELLGWRIDVVEEIDDGLVVLDPDGQRVGLWGP